VREVHGLGGAADGHQGRFVDSDEPHFFLSYAQGPGDYRVRRHPDPWIAQLYDDLCEHTRSLANLPPGTRTGFMDQGPSLGQEWSRQLSVSLATCHVFVPLYSRAYFKSEHCGKEWFAFNLRRLNYQAKRVRPVETIVPAPQIRAALEDALPRKLREGRATSALAVRGVPSLEDFGDRRTKAAPPIPRERAYG
jgi:hypothetical protein